MMQGSIDLELAPQAQEIESRSRLPFIGASLVILFFLLFQAAATFRVLCPPESLDALASLRVACAPKLWPFLDYPMYADSHQAGETINRFQVVGTLKDSKEVVISPEDLGMNFWLFQPFVHALGQGDIAEIKRYAAQYESRQGVELVQLRLETRPAVMTRQGVTFKPLKVVREVDLAAGVQ
jgi:hypothetical protein